MKKHKKHKKYEGITISGKKSKTFGITRENNGIDDRLPKNHITYVEMMEIDKKEAEKKEIGTQTVHKQDTNGTQDDLNSTQTVHKQDTNGTQDTGCEELKLLSGFQQLLSHHIIDICISKESLSIDNISGRYLKNFAKDNGYSPSSIKETITRLHTKGIIRKSMGRVGRNGYYNFYISEQIRNAYLMIKRYTNGTQMVHKQDTDSLKPETTSSSINLIEYINKEPLSDIGFTTNHLKDIQNALTDQGKEFDADRIQNSIYSLAHDMKNGFNHPSPINLIVGLLRKGVPYNASKPGYENPEEKAIKIDNERKQEAKKAKEKAEEWILNEEFEKWYTKTTREELDKLIIEKEGEGMLETLKGPMRKNYLIEYYKNNLCEV